MEFTRLVPALAACMWLTAQASGVETMAADCDGCHGPQGASVDGDIPVIGGQSHASIEKALEQFGEWSRPCRRSAYRHGDTTRPPRSMCEISEDLDEGQITQLAQFYARQEWVSAKQPFSEEQALEGAGLYALYCVTCHPGGGSETGYAGRLAGQWTPYLQAMTRQITSGEWLVPKIMKRKMSSFSEQEIDALLNYFASQND